MAKQQNHRQGNGTPHIETKERTTTGKALHNLQIRAGISTIIGIRTTGSTETITTLTDTTTPTHITEIATIAIIIIIAEIIILTIIQDKDITTTIDRETREAG